MNPAPLVDALNRFLLEGSGRSLFLASEFHKLSDLGDLQILSIKNPVGMISAGGVACDEFIKMLDENAYSAVLWDGAIISLQCQFRNNSLFSHRYMYVPCPFDRKILLERPEEILIADWLRDVKESKPDFFRSLGTFRFDFDQEVNAQTEAPHPVSHFTIASPDCRIPMQAPLSPSGFFDLIIENFYRTWLPFWQGFRPHLRCNGTDDTITAEEARSHHFARTL